MCICVYVFVHSSLFILHFLIVSFLNIFIQLCNANCHCVLRVLALTNSNHFDFILLLFFYWAAVSAV